MAKLLIDVPQRIKAKLEGLKREGYTMNGWIVALLERELGNDKPTPKKGR